ncbi:helix-turn-helix domain-containing protein [Fodinisporobacter ferrooxydans]|uniref:Helix-turn-helix domain-containing protein n=1 Tax=Fodinisporobacter ferrooxydans TaxID=2901836 RepID=A0ABY4CQK3_9BACL|nr:helix-turn-helix domain-containing protein [Alicyclobacillaceae bacterium MYW30-H2]
MDDTVGKRIRAYRKLKHLTQQEFADLLGVSVGLLGAIERGTKTCPAELIKRVGDLLQVSLEDLTSEENSRF